jgi:hypothetical protein
VLRQTIDLLAIGDRIAFEKGDFAFDLVVIIGGLGVAHPVGKDDQRPMHALAHLPAELLRLLVRHSDRAGEAVGHRLARAR